MSRVNLMIEGQEGVTWPQWVALARAAEDANLEGLFRSDHLKAIVRDEPNGALEAWATLAALAAVTTKLRLGTMVTPVTFRRAGILAKLVTTVDHISEGRAELGLGAAWFEAEHLEHGLAFPPQKDRLDELDRQLVEIQRQWSSVRPQPVQRPRPPIIVGGTAKSRTVRAAVRHADEYNTPWPSVEEARERKRAVDAAGGAHLVFSASIGVVVGRDGSETRERVTQFRHVTGGEAPQLSGTVEQVVERLREYEAVGVQRFMLQHLVHEDVEMVAVLGEVAAGLG
jgi:alkanesulfonate monooxygenase SsuD/methylene tetrahydromethanopterin reductase-like flavin-dependent oxidoreductase (luciferase family)